MDVKQHWVAIINTMNRLHGGDAMRLISPFLTVHGYGNPVQLAEGGDVQQLVDLLEANKHLFEGDKSAEAIFKAAMKDLAPLREPTLEERIEALENRLAKLENSSPTPARQRGRKKEAVNE